MATYYPEGACYFLRSSLKYNTNEWAADNPDNFYNHVLVEYQWNGWETSDETSKYHTRSVLKTGHGDGYSTLFGDWDRFYVGESTQKSPDEMLAVSGYLNSLNWNECRDRDKGGPRKYILRPIQIRSKDTQWLWIDSTIPLRAIYFPVCQQTDEAFPDYCTYFVIDFRAHKSIDIPDMDGNPHTFPVDAENGLGRNAGVTWGFKLQDIIAYLSLPNQLRNPEHGIFKAATKGEELMTWATSTIEWKTGHTINYVSFYREIDYASIVCASFGIDVGWRPYEYSSFIRDLIETALRAANGFVPGVGPLLSVAFGIGLLLVEDPDSFSSDNILDVDADIMALLTDAASMSKKYLAPNALAKGGTTLLAATTDEERDARKQPGDQINAQLTESVRQKYAGKSPENSSWWLERFANPQVKPSTAATGANKSVAGKTQSSENEGNIISVQFQLSTQEVAEANLRFK